MENSKTIEYMKHNSAGSNRALDLSKGFWLWRKLLGCPPSTPVLDYDLPAWCSLVKQTLVNEKMDKASVQLYIQNYFVRIPDLFPECFSPVIMKSGWEKSGLRPFYPIRMLQSCPAFYSIKRSDHWC